MGEAEFIGMLISALVVLVGFIVALVTPIVRLNTNIVKLNTSITQLIKDDERQNGRIEKHGKEIDELKKKKSIEFSILLRLHCLSFQ